MMGFDHQIYTVCWFCLLNIAHYILALIQMQPRIPRCTMGI